MASSCSARTRRIDRVAGDWSTARQRQLRGLNRLEDAFSQIANPGPGHPARRQELVRRHPELRRPGPLRREQALPAELVGLGQHREHRAPGAGEPLPDVLVVRARRMADVEQPHHSGERRPAGDHPLQQLPEPGPGGPGCPRESVPRQVEQITRREPEDVHELGLPGGRAHPGEELPSDQRVEETGLADVGAPHEGDLGEPGVERLEWIGEAADELDRQPGEDHASLIWRGRSVTTIGGLPSVMHSGVTITSRTSSREGRSNIRSVITVSRMARSPRAPVERLIALRATARSASASKVSPTSSSSNSFTYCLVMAFLGSIRIRTSDSSSSDSSGTTTGSRPTSSGISPNRSRSSGSAKPNGFFLSTSGDWSRALPAAKPICCRPSRPSMIFSSPSNAPPQMKRMSLVLIWMYSCWGCFRPPCGGTEATVPSRILSSACCTPSPETSRVMLGFSDLRAILSISSM